MTGCSSTKTHLPVLALAAACSSLKLRWSHDLAALSLDVEVRAAVSELQDAGELLADHPHFTRHLWVTPNDEARSSLGHRHASQLL